MTDGGRREHVSRTFRRLLARHRRPDGSEWGGQALEDATSGIVTRSYVSTLKKGNIDNPGILKLEAIARAMGFAPALWFGDEKGFEDAALAAALDHPTVRAIVREALNLPPRDKELLLGVARGISSAPRGEDVAGT